jgi:hypothetical protein
MTTREKEQLIYPLGCAIMILALWAVYVLQ